MRRLSISPVVLITALLALLLIAYVFSGGREPSTPDVRCASRGTLDLVKAELFRRAAAVRGTDDSAFSSVANYAVLRTNSRMLRSHDQSGAVHCAGSLALDLPPGVQVIGGAHTLTAKVSYVLVPRGSGKAALQSLSRADDIVQRLAALVPADGRTPGPLVGPTPSGPVASALEPSTAPPASVRPQTAKPEAAQAPKAAPPPAPAAPVAPPPRTEPPRHATRVASRQTSPAKPAPAPAPAPVSNPRPPIAMAAPSPSFRCGSARTPGEIAVCRNPDLARLDRQMASRFREAMSVAGPGPRVMLRRSGRRFIRYRDSCRSDACIADAYRGRIREIGDIMSGRF